MQRLHPSSPSARAKLIPGHRLVCPFLSTWSASKWNPVIRVFYQRLRANGKPPKVAMVPCMRKLLTILNAMVRDGREWDPSIPLEQLRLQHSC